MARFKYTDTSQGLFLTVNLDEQLLPGTFEWTLNHLIDRMDLSLFEQNYNNDKMGACAYSPKVLLKIICYCYSTGILSSRPMENACKINITVKALAENSEPDHATIAEFISTNSEAVNDLFTQVVMQCDELELITGEMFAIDGCKLPSNASKEWSGTIGSLKKKREKLRKHISRLLLRHQDLDKSEEAKKIQELTFSDITYCKGMDRVTLRGTEKVDIQWKLYCIIYNIGKCIRPLGKKNRA